MGVVAALQLQALAHLLEGCQLGPAMVRRRMQLRQRCHTARQRHSTHMLQVGSAEVILLLLACTMMTAMVALRCTNPHRRRHQRWVEWGTP